MNLLCCLRLLLLKISFYVSAVSLRPPVLRFSRALHVSRIELEIPYVGAPSLSSFPDTCSKAIHPAARKPGAAPQPTANNFAAAAESVVNKKDVSVAKTLRSGDHCSGRLAPDAAWSLRSRSSRANRRTPASPRAPVQKSERTAP